MHTIGNESQADKRKKLNQIDKKKYHFYTRMAKYCTTPRVNVEPAAMQGFFFLSCVDKSEELVRQWLKVGINQFAFCGHGRVPTARETGE